MSTNDQSSSENETYSKFQEATRNLQGRFVNEYKRYANQHSKFAPRILLAGPTGVGKSTLVNTVFGFREEEQAQVRAGGRPCTQNFSEYGPFERIPVIIVDSKGIEKELSKGQRKEMLKYVREQNNHLNIEKHVHVAWYIPGERWECSDILYVNELRHEALVKVVVVLTKCDLRLQIDEATKRPALEVTKSAIKASLPDVPIVECAMPPPGSTHWVPAFCSRGHGKNNFAIHNLKGTWTCQADVDGEECNERGREHTGPFGYVDLVRSTLDIVPELVRKALLVAQVVDMENKAKEAAKAVAFHTLVAMGVAACPIPFSDLPLLLALEASMGAILFNIYDIDPSIVTPEVWFKLNAVGIRAVGFIAAAIAKALKATMVLAPVGSAVDTIVAGTVVATAGCALTAVCQRLPPRSSVQDVDKNSFAEHLLEVAKAMKTGFLDTILKETAEKIGLGDRSGDGLVDKLIETINSVSEDPNLGMASMESAGGNRSSGLNASGSAAQESAELRN